MARGVKQEGKKDFQLQPSSIGMAGPVNSTPAWRPASQGDFKMSDTKKPSLDHPINPLLANRWSPCAFAERPVSTDDVRSIFEAARWAASSYNEQPWRYIVATNTDREEFERLLSCLVEANQAWAKEAPVLALGCTHLKFARNGQPNAAGEHDLGAASASLTLEATARGLFVHQMIGILPDRARELYAIPDDVRPLTGIAIGYLGDPNALHDKYRQRDLSPRQRKPLTEIVFRGRWGEASDLLK
jgi:nitroreductase